ncbi:MAG: RNA polymerase sigma-70 factor [Chitinophaga sp.]|uniref:RNA polymerase sigma-70 factor n=1 Tax=Chitinophaga sp. TaxID=1869181 RepID=UPI001B1E17A1|nr:RNA polymerase sigma-70 factor [Chitinophaga sp.]MBO9732626.1 RNA polymerase sigma-70 factor [Chitinophaga sp.]
MPNDTSHYNEKEVLESVAASSEEAFKQLFEAHYNKLASFILRLTRSHSITEELVQDVFVKVWLHRAELPAVNNFDAWAYVIARNLVFNHLKKAARELQHHQDWQYSHHPEIHDSRQDSEPDIYAALERTIEKLPPQQKMIYLLKRRNGMKNEEIARQLKISTATVKKHFSLALRFIKDQARQGFEILLLLLFFFF